MTWLLSYADTVIRKLKFFSLAFIFLFTVLLNPVSARAFSEEEKLEMAKHLTALLPALQVTYTGSPILVGDPDPVVFKLTPSGKSGFGKLFLSGRYDIIHRPDDTFNLGSYFCHLGQEFVKVRRKQNAGFFLPKMNVNIPLKLGEVGFEISGDQETIADVVYGFLYLLDWASDADYGQFEILVRGFADEGQDFVGTMLDYHPINKISLLPAKSADPLRLFYLRSPVEQVIGQQFGNAELPNLRAAYLREIIAAFLSSCGLQQNGVQAAHVLDGAVINERNEDYRSIEIFFYAYR